MSNHFQAVHKASRPVGSVMAMFPNFCETDRKMRGKQAFSVPCEMSDVEREINYVADKF